MCKFNKKNDSRRIDHCMGKFILEITMMMDKQFKTRACCCGHGKYPMTLVVEDLYLKVCKEVFSNKIISRKKRFYKKDGDGYYYIPEVSKPRFKTKVIKRKNSASIIRRAKR